MARSRNIKPGFFINEELSELSFETRLLFIGLWTIADRDGRLEDRPKRIHISCLPYDQVNVDSMLTDLESSGFIIRYSAEGKKYIQIINWLKHQAPHHKEANSEIPKHNINHKDSHAQVMHDSSMAQERGNKNASCPTDSLNPITDSLTSLSTAEIPKKFEAESENFLIAKYPTLDLEKEKEKFIAHYTANGSERKDWQAQFRKWLLDAQQIQFESSQRAPPKNGNSNNNHSKKLLKSDHGKYETVESA